MKKYIPILKRTRLFSGISEEEINKMINCLQAKKCSYKKDEYIFHQGDHIDNLMVLVEGQLYIQRDDYWGNRSIINIVTAGDMFGESYAASHSNTLINDIIAVEDCTVIFFDVKRVITVCPNACRFHSIVVQNLFFSISEKNRKLIQKLSFMTKRTTREKLITFLSEQSKQHNSSEFSIPFNRQQLADFLSVDRSAMSNELCKMRDEGFIEFKKNRFVLHSK